MSASKDPELSSSSAQPVGGSGADCEVVVYEGDLSKKKTRKRRLVMLCNTLGLTLIVIVIVTSLSLSSSEEKTYTRDLKDNNGSYGETHNTTLEPLPTAEARHSTRKVVAFMPISVNHDDFESFSRIDYLEGEYEDDDYMGEVEENRFGVGIKRRKNRHRLSSRYKNPYRKKQYLPSTMSLPRIKNRAKLDYLYKKSKQQLQNNYSKRYSHLPDLHKRPGPPYMNNYNRASNHNRRITRPKKKKKKKTPSALIIIEKKKRNKKASTDDAVSSKYSKIKRRRKLRPDILDFKYNRDRKKVQYNSKRNNYVETDNIRNNKPPIRRPPPKHPGVRIPGVRYPSNSGNIRDIIEYMKKKSPPELESHAAGIYQTAQNGYVVPYHVSSNGTSSSWYNPSSNSRAETHSYTQPINKYSSQSVSTSYPVQTPPKYFDPNKFNYVFLPSPPTTTPKPPPIIKHPQSFAPNGYDRRGQHLHQGIPIHSLGYDPNHPDGPDYSEVTTLKKASGPLSIGLDVYPIEGHSKSSSASSRFGSKKQEVLLHLNLFSNNPISSKKGVGRPQIHSTVPPPPPPKVEFAKKPYLPTSYYYFSTPGSQHGDKRVHPAQSSSLVETLDRGTNGRVDEGTNAEDILKYLASSINEGNLRIGNHEIKISTNSQNTSSNLLDKNRLLNYLNHRIDKDSSDIHTRRQQEKPAKKNAEESNPFDQARDNALSTTSIVETVYEAPKESTQDDVIVPISTSSPLFEHEASGKNNEDFEYYYQYYYDYVYPEELEEAQSAANSSTKA